MDEMAKADSDVLLSGLSFSTSRFHAVHCKDLRAQASDTSNSPSDALTAPVGK
jgi:hypothetical protein